MQTLRPQPIAASSFRLVCIAYGFLLLAVVTFWIDYAANQRGVVSYAYRTDFLGVYVGARTVAIGHGMRVYDFDEQRAQMNEAVLPYRRGNLMPFIYPAYVALLFWPVGMLSFGHAVIGFEVLNLLIALWTALLVALRLVTDERHRFLVLLAFFSFVPLSLTLFHNQLGLFVTLGIVQAVLAIRSHQLTRAGCWLLAGLIKPQLILFPLFVLLLWRCWRVLWPFFLGAGIVVGASFSVLGFWIPRYVGFLREYNRGGAGLSLSPEAMQNWRGLLLFFLHRQGLGFRMALASLAAISLVAVVVVSTGQKIAPNWAKLACPPSKWWEPRFGIAILLGLLSSPHLYMHDWIVFAPAGVLLWQPLKNSSHLSGRIIRVLLVACPFIFWFAQFGEWSLGISVPCVPFYMGIVGSAAFLALRKPELGTKTD
ncbi:MAG TPA: glycosyltransferase family 87 protein [Candidatus Sulfotelmatobacter sp.]|nr:glycosyltransferase family 87 protein [Candidatus Sulfotelmatobacter sp.]